ncbi:MAG TPA: serine/threonine-protein kinase [Pyrinomonadaceae bacterium]|jgi:serine/threonine protein kinase
MLQNRYLVVQLIGKGGMGEVYLAVDQRLGSAVALKRTFFSDNDLLRNAFEREARTLARLRHGVLPKVSDHFTENETQYLVMEHISGDDLSKRLEITRKPFPLNWVLFWADQLLDALAYLHTHEPPIVHRDIKPQNLKLTNENHIILLDFGLAKDTGASRVSTTGGSIVGYTPHYAPMEQIRGTGTTAKSDIYSLSATLYQLLTAQVPPDALTRADSVLNSLPDPTEPIDKINPEVPRLISDVILKGMALSMDARYANAREMQKALREAYAQMQSKMSAETMAFTLPPQQQQQPPPPVNQTPVTQSQQLTEQFATPIVSQPQPQPQPQPPTQLPPTRHDSLPSQQKTENLHIAPPPPETDFEATMKDTNLSPTSLPSLPSQQKTEVLPTEISSQIPKKEESYNPEATVPIVSFDQNADGSEPVGATQAVSNFDSVPTEVRQPQPQYGSPYNTAAATGTTGAAGGRTQTENAYQPAPLVGETKKKSGKGLAIAAVLGGLVFVMLAAAGVGLYAFGDQLGITGTKPTPTPAPTAQPSVTPTPAPTMERANTSTGNSANQQVANTGQTNKANTQVAETNKTTEPTTVKPVVTTTPPPRVVTTTQPVRTTPPVTRTPKPVAAKTQKPVLLQ